MKGIMTALGILCFASAMACAKTGKFHAPPAVAAAHTAHTRWHRPHSSRETVHLSLDTAGG